MRIPAIFSILCMLLLLFSGCRLQHHDHTQHYTFTVVQAYPHDPSAFTEGLVWDHGSVYESTGKLGWSSLRRVDLRSGKVLQLRECNPAIFGEGIAVLGDRIYQLTWKNHLAFVYDKLDFSLLKTVTYARQGWGLTTDKRNLVASDGTSSLYFLDPSTLTPVRKITVRDHGRQIRYLNELEYIKGKIYANVYRSNRIAIISPADGKVDGWIDLDGLRRRLKLHDADAVLNGIMYDSQNDRLFITGKYWPALFEIRIRPAPKME